MNRKTARTAILAAALPAALLSGCFTTDPVVDVDRDWGWGGNGWGGGGPDNGTATPGDTSEAIYPTDVAVDPGSGELVMLGSGEAGTVIVVIDRDSGAVKRSWNVPFWGMSIGTTAPGRAFTSNGSLDNYTIDLVTGEFERTAGMDALGERTASYADGGGGDLGSGGEGDVATLECEPSPGSPIDIWGGDGSSRALVRTVPLDADVWHVEGVAYAPDRNLVFVLTGGEAIRALSTVDGSLAFVVADLSGGYEYPIGLAYDPVGGRVLTTSIAYDSIEAEWSITEYPL